MAIKNRPEFENSFAELKKALMNFVPHQLKRGIQSNIELLEKNLAHLVDENSFLEFGQLQLPHNAAVETMKSFKIRPMPMVLLLVFALSIQN